MRSADRRLHAWRELSRAARPSDASAAPGTAVGKRLPGNFTDPAPREIRTAFGDRVITMIGPSGLAPGRLYRASRNRSKCNLLYFLPNLRRCAQSARKFMNSLSSIPAFSAS